MIPGMQLVIGVIYRALPDIGYVLCIWGVFVFIFANICMNFFKGQFKRCQGEVWSDVISMNYSMRVLLENPSPWSQLSSNQQILFSSSSPIVSYFNSSCTIPIPGSVPYPCCSSLQGMMHSSAAPTGRGSLISQFTLLLLFHKHLSSYFTFQYHPPPITSHHLPPPPTTSCIH